MLDSGLPREVVSELASVECQARWNWSCCTEYPALVGATLEIVGNRALVDFSKIHMVLLRLVRVIVRETPLSRVVSGSVLLPGIRALVSEGACRFCAECHSELTRLVDCCLIDSILNGDWEPGIAVGSEGEGPPQSGSALSGDWRSILRDTVV